MRSALKHFFAERKTSTAKKTQRQLKKKGLEPGEIEASHVADVYKKLRRARSAPKFDQADQVFVESTLAITPVSSPLVGAIVETREHPALEYVVKSFLSCLQSPIQIFHGQSNRDYIMGTSLAEHIENGQIRLTQLATNHLDAKKYNALLLSEEFWLNLEGRNKILLFQTDSICCAESPYAIQNFLDYDYIGSRWNRQRPIGLIIDGGSGGLSLRDWEKSLTCLRHFPPTSWSGGEDGYFAFHIELIGGKVGDAKACSRFSTQGKFENKSWGAHQVSRLTPQKLESFLGYCKEASFMLDPTNNNQFLEISSSTEIEDQNRTQKTDR